MTTRTCDHCGGVLLRRPDRQRFCSRRCGHKADSWAKSGTKNPNWALNNRKCCLGCGAWYTAKNTNRQYCSRSCSALVDTPARAAARRRCGRVARPYQRNPENRLKRCRGCSTFFGPTGLSARAYCNRLCADQHQRRSGIAVDSNQAEIMAAFRAMGAGVIDTSGVGGGFPDLIVGYAGDNHLVEIKNPRTTYGRRGFSRLQRAWADAHGFTVNLVSSVPEAELLLNECEERQNGAKRA